MKSRVETETTSHRMVVLKDFADKSVILEKYPGIMEYPEYPGYLVESCQFH